MRRLSRNVSNEHPSMNCGPSPILSRMSYSANRARSESIDRVAVGMGPNIGLHALAAHHVNAKRKQVLDAMLDADIPEQINVRIGRNIDHDVDVAVGTVFASRARTEQGRVRDAARA